MARTDYKHLSDGQWPVASPSLTAIVERVQALANASGAAIALVTPGAKEIECCARSGGTAPPLGRSVLAEGTLTALCVRSGQRLLCDDVETDPRVRSTGIATLGIRSVVLTPIMQGNQSTGVLTVFSDRVDAFSAIHLAEFDAAAIRISRILAGEDQTAGNSSASLLSTPESGVGSHDAAAPKPVSAWWSRFAPRVPSLPSLDLQEEARQTDLPPLPFTMLDTAAEPPRRFAGNLIGALAALFLIAAGAVLFSLAGSDRSAASLTVGSSAHKAPSELSVNNTSHSSSAAVGSSALRLDPERITAHRGGTFSLNVDFSRRSAVVSVALQVNYDPKLVQFISVAQDGSLEEDGQQLVLAHRDDPVAGILKISAQGPLRVSGASNGTILGLIFRARARGTCRVSVTPGVRDDQGRAFDLPGSQASISIN